MWKSAIICSILVLISGCVSVRLPSQPKQHFKVIPVQTRLAKLSKMDAWSIRGALSITDKNQSNIANYFWHQSSRYRYWVRLSSSLNLYELYIIGQGKYVSLWRGKEHTQARSPEALLQRAMGWSIPISDLYFWIRGMPAPGMVGLTQYDRYGHLSRLQQYGWAIDYRSYTQEGGLDLPRLVTLVRPGLRVRIVVKQWDPNS